MFMIDLKELAQITCNQRVTIWVSELIHRGERQLFVSRRSWRRNLCVTFSHKNNSTQFGIKDV